MEQDNVQWLYDNLSAKGVQLGTPDQFKTAMKDKASQIWAYKQAVKHGVEVGTPEQYYTAMSSAYPTSAQNNTKKSIEDYNSLEEYALANGVKVDEVRVDKDEHKKALANANMKAEELKQKSFQPDYVSPNDLINITPEDREKYREYEAEQARVMIKNAEDSQKKMVEAYMASPEYKESNAYRAALQDDIKKQFGDVKFTAPQNLKPSASGFYKSFEAPNAGYNLMTSTDMMLAYPGIKMEEIYDYFLAKDPTRKNSPHVEDGLDELDYYMLKKKGEAYVKELGGDAEVEKLIRKSIESGIVPPSNILMEVYQRNQKGGNGFVELVEEGILDPNTLDITDSYKALANYANVDYIQSKKKADKFMEEYRKRKAEERRRNMSNWDKFKESLYSGVVRLGEQAIRAADLIDEKTGFSRNIFKIAASEIGEEMPKEIQGKNNRELVNMIKEWEASLKKLNAKERKNAKEQPPKEIAWAYALTGITRAADSLKDEADYASAAASVSDKGFFELLSNGEFGTAFMQGLMTAAESLPQTAMATSGVGMVALGLFTGSSEYDKLRTEHPEMSDAQIFACASACGFFTAYFESKWNPFHKIEKPLDGSIRRYIQTFAKASYKDLLKAAKGAGKEILKDMHEEGWEEVCTSLSTQVFYTIINWDGDSVGFIAEFNKAYAEALKRNPNLSREEFAKEFSVNTVVGFMDDYIGGWMSGGYMGASTKAVSSAVNNASGQKVSDGKGGTRKLTKEEMEYAEAQAELMKKSVDVIADISGKTADEVLYEIDHEIKEDGSVTERSFSDAVAIMFANLAKSANSKYKKAEAKLKEQQKAQAEAQSTEQTAGNAPIEPQENTGQEPVQTPIEDVRDIEQPVKAEVYIRDKNGKGSRRTVVYSGKGIRFNEDGTIDAENSKKLHIKNVQGEEITGKERKKWVDALNNTLSDEKKIEDARLAREERARIEKADKARQAAEEQAKLEQHRQEVIAEVEKTMPVKDGVVDDKHATPAHTFVWNLKNKGSEKALGRAANAIGEKLYELEKLQDDTSMSSASRDAAMDRAELVVQQYEQIINELAGKDVAQQVRAAAEAYMTELLNRDMEAANEQEKARLNRIAERQRVREENRRKYAEQQAQNQKPVEQPSDAPKETPKEEPAPAKPSPAKPSPEKPKKEKKTEMPKEEKPKQDKPKKEKPAPAARKESVAPFDENVALVQYGDRKIKFVNRNEVKEGETEIPKRVVYAKEGNTYVPYIIRSAKEKFGPNSAVPVVGKDGTNKSIYASQLYVDEKGSPFVGSELSRKGKRKLKVSSLKDVISYPVYTDKNGNAFTLEDLLTPHGEMSGYAYVRQQVDAENPGDAEAMQLFHQRIHDVIDRWNALAETLLDSKGYHAAKLIAYRYLLYKNARSAAFDNGNFKEAHRIDGLIDGPANFNVGTGFDARNLDQKGLNNPLMRIACMIEITKDMPGVKEIAYEGTLSEDLQKALNKSIITAKEIERLRQQYKELSSKKADVDSSKDVKELEEIDKLEEKVPEVKTNYAPLTRERGKKGYDAVKEYYKQEAGEVRRERKQSKEQEELTKFEELCQQAVDAFKEGDMSKFAKLSGDIAKTIEAHAKDKVNKFANRLKAFQSQIRAILNAAFPQTAKIARLHKQLDEVNEIIASRQKAVDDLTKALADVEAMLEGLKSMLNTDENVKESERLTARKEKLIEQLAKAQEELNRPLATNPRDIQEKLSSAIATNPEAEAQYQEMTKQELPENGLKVEFAMEDEQDIPAKTPHTKLILKTLGKLFGFAGIQPHYAGNQEQAREVLRQVMERYGINPEMMSVFHGSGAIFDRFDLSHIGEGEGNQAFGWGQYVTKRYGVAKSYAEITKRGGYDDEHDGYLMGQLLKDRDAFGYGDTLESVMEELVGDRDKIVVEEVEFARKYGVYFGETKQYLEERNGRNDDAVALDVFSLLYDYAQEADNNRMHLSQFGLPISDREFIFTCKDLNRRFKNANKSVIGLALIERYGNLNKDTKWADVVKKGDEILKNNRPSSNIYSVEIPDDNGSNYFPWHEDIPEEERKRIADELKARGVISEDWEYELIMRPQDEKTGILFNTKGGDIYRAIQRAYEKRKRALFDGERIDSVDRILKEMLPHLPKETGIRTGRGREWIAEADHQAEKVIKYFMISVNKGKNLPVAIKQAAISAARENQGSVSDADKYNAFLDAAEEWLKDNMGRFSIEKERADKLTSDFLRSLGYVGNKVPIGYYHQGKYKGEDNMNYIIFNDNDLEITGREKVEFFKDENGTILGWAIGNEMWLTDEGMNSETPIHEYTHLWVKALRNENPSAWTEIVKRLKKNKHLWDEVANDPNYANIKDDEDAIASEMLARFSGKNGAKRLEEMARKIAQKGGLNSDKLVDSLINNMREALREFWRVIKNLFMPNSNVTIDEIADLVLKDLFDGKPLNLNTQEMNEIKEQSIKNGTFMKAPNGRDTKLTERQWLSVRTKAFKEMYGDWENDPEHATKILDPETGEPMVVYHGTDQAGFDLFNPQDNGESNGRGIFMTPQRFVAGVYAGLTGEEGTEYEASLGQEEHRGIYSLFANIKNPLVVDCTDEEGNPSMWHSIPTGKWKVVGPNMVTQYFNTYEEAAEWMYENGFGIEWQEGMEDVGEPEILPDTYTTDQFVDLARQGGYDGVIFKNIIDGTDSKLLDDVSDDSQYMQPHDVVVAMTPNQLKSAVTNNGLYSEKDARVEYSVSMNELNHIEDTERKKLIEAEKKGKDVMLDMKKDTGMKLDELHDLMARYADQMEGMRVIQNSINAYRKVMGLPPMDTDVRTMFEGSTSAAYNRIESFRKNEKKELEKTATKLQKAVAKTDFYKSHNKVNVNGKDVTLTPLQFIELYLIARNNFERAKEDKIRGAGAFAELMGYVLGESPEVKSAYEQFVEGFHNSVDAALVEDLWKSIETMTHMSLQIGFEGGLITEDEYEELMEKKYFVPQRGFWNDINGDLDSEESEPTAVRKNGRWINRLSFMQQAEGGISLAEGPLAYIYSDVEEAIQKAENNKVKVAFFNMLRDNSDWCSLPEVGFETPTQVFYEVDEDGKIQRVENTYTPEEIQDFKRLRKRVRELEKLKKKPGVTEEQILEYDAEIDEIESMIPMSALNTRSLYGRRNKEKTRTIGVLVDGYQCEIVLPKSFHTLVDAMNGKRVTDGQWEFARQITGFFAAQLTVNNPGFFAVNLARDIQWINMKGMVEYGPLFNLHFAKNLAMGQKQINQWLITGKFPEGDKWGKYMKEFLEGGGNTGFMANLDLASYRADVKNIDIKSSNVIKILSTAKDAALWRHVANYMNEWSELTTRFAAYCSLREMGKSEIEAVRGAKNLSVNFDRKGLGTAFLNIFQQFSVFVNATIQGVMGKWRMYGAKAGSTNTQKAGKALWAATVSILSPMFFGFLNALTLPDDDDKELMVSAWDRDNFIVLPNALLSGTPGVGRIPLDQNIRVPWCIGVNMAMLAKKRRTPQEAFNSIATSMVQNSMPIPQNLSNSIGLALDNVMGGEYHNLGEIALAVITPSAMEQLEYLANHMNFLGGKMRVDAGDIPEFEMGEYESDLAKDLSQLMYALGGDTNVSSKHNVDDNGNVSKIHGATDVNPKEVASYFSGLVIPSGTIDILATAYGLSWGVAEGNIEEHVTEKRIPVYHSFVHKMPVSSYRYKTIKEVRGLVQDWKTARDGSNQQALRYGVIAEKADNEEDRQSALERKKAAEERYKTILENGDNMIKLNEYLEVYDAISKFSMMKSLGLVSQKELNQVLHSIDMQSIDEAEKNLVANMNVILYEMKGLKWSGKEPKRIQFVNEY